jgi:argininosuccinate synthase
MADLIYSGQWFSPLRRALQAFADNATQAASGEVTVELFRGQARAIRRTSPMSLYRPALASFDMAGYDRSHAEGFIRLFGLPLASAAQRGASTAPSDGNGGAAPAAPATEVTHAG